MMLSFPNTGLNNIKGIPRWLIAGRSFSTGQRPYTAGPFNSKMTSQKIDLGKQGETLALNALNKSGYKIIEKNFKNVLGEIDIIALEQIRKLRDEQS